MAKPKAQNYSVGEYIDYTTLAATTGGTPTQISDGIVGIPTSDAAITTEIGMQIAGIIKIECDVSVGNAGDNVWYDNNGSPYSGTALSGAATTLAASGDFWLGTLVEDTGATDTHAYVALNVRYNCRGLFWGHF